MRVATGRRDAWNRRLSSIVTTGDVFSVCGVEHEFVVRDESGTVLDARVLLPTLVAARRRLDPIDPYARTLPDGGVLTADGREAEIAIAPVELLPGFSQRAGEAAAAAQVALGACLPEGARLEGFSTHLSVQVRDRHSPGATRFIAERFAPLLMLALDTPESAGLLFRARWNRVEIGGDYVDAELLRAALVIAVACVRGSLARSTRRKLPAKPTMVIEPSIERFGWYVDRNASDSDLYVLGRAGVLRCGRTQMTVQDYIRACWAVLEPAMSKVAGAEELALARDLVHGRLRSPLDR